MIIAMNNYISVLSGLNLNLKGYVVDPTAGFGARLFEENESLYGHLCIGVGVGRHICMLLLVAATVCSLISIAILVVSNKMRYTNLMTGRQKEMEQDGNTTSAKPLLYSTKVIGKDMCNIILNQELDLMSMKTQPFVKRFKNPCWYKEETLLCLPYMYLVGVAKCGTTDLFKRITLHPDFVAPTIKEPNWLSSGRFWRKETFSYYVSEFFSPLSSALSKSEFPNLITGFIIIGLAIIEKKIFEPNLEYNKRFLNRHRAIKISFLIYTLLSGEASINTMEGAPFWPYLGINVGHNEPLENNPEYIYHLNRETRILINVRNPVDRLWSEYLAFSRNENLSAERFHEIVKKALRVYRDCLQANNLRSCMYDRPLALLATMTEEEGQSLKHHCSSTPVDLVMVRRGVYHVFVKDYLKVFPRQHVLIQRLEDISDDIQLALTRTYTFLGLKIPSAIQMQQILNRKIENANKSLNKGEMLESTRRILYEFYKPHNEQLALLLNDSRYNYGPRG